MRPLTATQTDLKPWNHLWSKVIAQYGPNHLFNPPHTSIPVHLRLSELCGPDLQPEHFPTFPVRNMLVRFAFYLLHRAEPNDLISKWVGLPRTEKEKCILDMFGHLVGLDMFKGQDKDL